MKCLRARCLKRIKTRSGEGLLGKENDEFTRKVAGLFLGLFIRVYIYHPSIRWFLMSICNFIPETHQCLETIENVWGDVWIEEIRAMYSYNYTMKVAQGQIVHN